MTYKKWTYSVLKWRSSKNTYRGCEFFMCYVFSILHAVFTRMLCYVSFRFRLIFCSAKIKILSPAKYSEAFSFCIFYVSFWRKKISLRSEPNWNISINKAQQKQTQNNRTNITSAIYSVRPRVWRWSAIKNVKCRNNKKI